MHTLGSRTYGLEPLFVSLVLAANPGERPKDSFEKKGPLLVAARGALRQPAIDQKDGRAQIARPPKEIGPDFRFHEHHRPGLNDTKSAPHKAPPINGVINL